MTFFRILGQAQDRQKTKPSHAPQYTFQVPVPSSIPFAATFAPSKEAIVSCDVIDCYTIFNKLCLCNILDSITPSWNNSCLTVNMTPYNIYLWIMCYVQPRSDLCSMFDVVRSCLTWYDLDIFTWHSMDRTGLVIYKVHCNVLYMSV